MVLLRDMVTLYKDMRVVLMSATIDTNLFTDYFTQCSVIEVEGRTFPVQGTLAYRINVSRKKVTVRNYDTVRCKCGQKTKKKKESRELEVQFGVANHYDMKRGFMGFGAKNARSQMEQISKQCPYIAGLTNRAKYCK